MENLLKNKSQVNVHLGCGEEIIDAFINLDAKPGPGVDVVWNLEKFPWPFPDGSVDILIASQLLEHINPMSISPQLIGMIQLLLDKKIITLEEIYKYVGDLPLEPIFIHFMNEAWRVLKTGGQFMIATPYAGSIPYWQDPSHINGINEYTIAYFDPFDALTGGGLYRNYKPMPWKIVDWSWFTNGNMEVLLEKRPDDPSYHEATLSFSKLHPVLRPVRNALSKQEVEANKKIDANKRNNSDNRKSKGK
jgi:SAM-dependent methyltransferase